MVQKTIKRKIQCSGIGLHSGSKVSLVLDPAPEGTGVIFSIKGSNGTRFLSLHPESVSATGLATTIGNGQDAVATVEHILAAVRGMDIDNIRIECDGREVPIMDGSAAPFVFLLRQAGIRRQSMPRTVWAVKRPINFEKDGKFIKARPFDGLAVDYTIDFDHPLVGRQRLSYVQSPDEFVRKLARARTFGFMRDVERMHQMGLALGGSLDNAVVLDEYGVLNPEGLRFTDEFVRHKVLDFLGDMALFGDHVWGRFEVFASGHALNNAFLRYLNENRDYYLEPVTLWDAPERSVPADAHVTAGEGKAHIPVTA